MYNLTKNRIYFFRRKYEIGDVKEIITFAKVGICQLCLERTVQKIQHSKQSENSINIF